MSSSTGGLSYTDGFNQKLRPLLDKYDNIRHLLEDDPDLHATSIVVIGDQSSGKSSVLESLIQIGLPRGENIVTRMPIILQCRCLKPNSSEKPHAQVSISSPNDKRSFPVDEFADLEATIRKCQDSVMEDMGLDSSVINDDFNQISETPIYVQIVKEGIPDVTLIDLPGINYTNDTIKGQIGAMYKRYIEKSNVIILNVISAVTDIKANESVLFAKKADSEEERTIFVLTKVDKCSREDILAKVRELKTADSRFVFVRNRNQDEIASNMSWNELRQKEKSFLANLHGVDSECKGIPALGLILVNEGYKMILQSVDHLLDRIPRILKELKQEVSNMGEPCVTDIEKKSYFDKIAHKMSPRVQQLLNGSSDAGDSENLLLNSKIQKFLKIFEEKFTRGADMIFTKHFQRQIERSLDDTEGLTLPNFLSNPVFSTMLNRLMKNSEVYKNITQDVLLGERGKPDSGIVPYINSVMDVLIDEALKGQIIDERFGNHFRSNLKDFIEKTGREVAISVTQLVDAELEAGPFTTDPQYLETIQNVETQVQALLRKRESGTSADSQASKKSNGRKISSTSSSDDSDLPEVKNSISIGQGFTLCDSDIDHIFGRNGQTVFLMQTSLFSYWMIVRKRLRDHAHLLVMFALCGKLRKWEELMNSLWKENSAQYIRLLVENRSVTLKRNLLGKRIQRLEEASLVLNSISLEP